MSVDVVRGDTGLEVHDSIGPSDIQRHIGANGADLEREKHSGSNPYASPNFTNTGVTKSDDRREIIITFTTTVSAQDRDRPGRCSSWCMMGRSQIRSMT